MAIRKVKRNNKLSKENPEITPIAASIIESYPGDTIKVPSGSFHEKGQLITNHNLTIEGKDKEHTKIYVETYQVLYVLGSQTNLTLKNLTIILPNQTNAILIQDDASGQLTLDNVNITYIDPLLPLSDKYPAITTQGGLINVLIKQSHIPSIVVNTIQTHITNSVIGSHYSPLSQINTETNLDAHDSTLNNLQCLTPNQNKNTNSLSNISSTGDLILQGVFNIINFKIIDIKDYSMQKKLFKKTPDFVTWLEAQNQINNHTIIQLMHAQIELTGDISSEKTQNINQTKWLSAIDSTIGITDTNIPKMSQTSIIQDSTIKWINTTDLNYYDLINTNSSALNSTTTVTTAQTNKTALEEINEMIGLQNVKETLNKLISLAKLNNERQQRGLKQSTDMSLHMLFLGNPGTGKTVIARLLAKALYEEGLLQKDTLLNVSAKDLIAGYKGQTRIQTREKIDEARGGILFIDEAYSLHGTDASDKDFANAAVQELLQAMEDYREDLIVIMAGYTNEMLDFIHNDNPGLKSRFTNYIYFDDYSLDELKDILKYHLTKNNAQPADLSAETMMNASLTQLYNLIEKTHETSHGNGRFIRNYVQNILLARDARLNNNDNLQHLTDDELNNFTADDIKQAKQIMKQSMFQTT